MDNPGFNLPWPVTGIELFRDDLPDWTNNAGLQLPGKWFAYSEAYRIASQAILGALKGSHTADINFLVYPLVFCYRQHLELAMKNLIQAGRRLNDEPEDFIDSHNLVKLWLACREILKDLDPPPETTDLEVVGEKIEQLHLVDPDGMAFRYPVGTAKKGRRPLLPGELKQFNVRHFAEQIEQIASFLVAASEQIAVNLDWKCEIQSDLNDP